MGFSAVTACLYPDLNALVIEILLQHFCQTPRELDHQGLACLTLFVAARVTILLDLPFQNAVYILVLCQYSSEEISVDNISVSESFLLALSIVVYAFTLAIISRVYFHQLCKFISRRGFVPTRESCDCCQWWSIDVTSCLLLFHLIFDTLRHMSPPTLQVCLTPNKYPELVITACALCAWFSLFNPINSGDTAKSKLHPGVF